MKKIIVAVGIVLSAGSLILSGNMASAKDNRGAHQAVSGPMPKGNTSPVYKPMAPHFASKPALKNYSGSMASKSPALTKQAGQQYHKSGASAKSPFVTGRTKPLPTTAKSPPPKNPDAAKWSHDDHKGKSKLDARSTERLRNWQGKKDTLAEARDKHKHKHHDHDWWHRHCVAIVLVNWGYWGWDAGWWYPAWGYDPYYSNYEYDGPIYSYDGLPPDQVIANVQGALQREGYYSYAVDGVMGPLIESALYRYQQDHGLAITGTIDPATLRSLGFIA